MIAFGDDATKKTFEIVSSVWLELCQAKCNWPSGCTKLKRQQLLKSHATPTRGDVNSIWDLLDVKIVTREGKNMHFKSSGILINNLKSHLLMNSSSYIKFLF